MNGEQQQLKTCSAIRGKQRLLVMQLFENAVVKARRDI